MSLKKLLKGCLPLLLFIAIAPFTPKLDIIISNLFYSVDPQPKGSFASDWLVETMYHYGMIPAFILFGISCIAFTLSFYFPKILKWRAPAAFMILSFGIAPGLLVNVLLKGLWGRPRPIQIKYFGGEQDFRPFYIPNFSSEAKFFKSFPSGHCTMGFIFFTLYIIGKRLQKKGLFYLGIALTVLLSATLAYARIARGGHFFSDVLGAGLVTWYVCLFFEWVIFHRFAYLFPNSNVNMSLKRES